MRLAIFFLLFIPAGLAVGLAQQEHIMPAMRSADSWIIKILLASVGALSMAATFWGIVWLVNALPSIKR